MENIETKTCGALIDFVSNLQWIYKGNRLGKNIRYTPTKVNEHKSVFQKGQLTDKNGVPYLKLSGNYYEVGLQYGVLMREQIITLNKEVRKLFRLSVPWFFKIFTNIYINLKLQSMGERIPQRYREELKGLADGTGLSYDEILLFPLFPEGLHGGCTSILQRIDDRVVLVRNLDYLPFLGEYPIVVEYNVDGKQKMTSFGVIGFPGVLTGFNEKGIGLSLNHIKMTKSNKSKDMPIGYKTRDILETANTIDDVDDLLKSYSSETGWDIIISSTHDNDGAIFDIAATGVKRHDLKAKSYLVVNNTFLDDNLKHENMGILTAKNFRNQGRNESAKDQLEKGKMTSIDECIHLLSSVKFYQYDDLELGLGHYTINNEQSIQSVIIDVKHGETYFSVGKGYSGFGPYYKYNTSAGSVEVYQDDNKSPQQSVKGLIERRDKVFDMLIRKNHRQLIEDILTLNNPTIYEISEIIRLKEQKDHEKLLLKIDKNIKKYRELPQMYMDKGKTLIDLHQIDEAIEILEGVLDMCYIYPADVVRIYMYLADAYFKKADRGKAMTCATKCINLIREYDMGEQERKIIENMERYIPDK